MVRDARVSANAKDGKEGKEGKEGEGRGSDGKGGKRAHLHEVLLLHGVVLAAAAFDGLNPLVL